MIEFEGLSENIHYCTSHIDKDWIVWRCPHCEGYERRLNWKTGEMRVNRGNSLAQHTGTNQGKDNISEPLTKNISEN